MKVRVILLVSFLMGMLLTSVYAQDEVVEVSSEGISFSFDAALASDVEAVDVEAVQWTPDMPIWATNPAFTQFSFTDYANGAAFYSIPLINIYSVADFADYTDPSAPEFGMMGPYNDLLTILDEEPDLSDFEGVALSGIEPTLPYLPVANAQQVFRAQAEYLDFGSGKGIRYVTYYSQSVNPITDQEIFYTFQGVTDDGLLYVSAVFPVKTGILPEEIDFQDFDYTAFESEYMNYLSETAAGLIDLDPEGFFPTLTTLDDLVASITIEE